MAQKEEFHAVPPESHAQELLASERTFLSWIRTSIAVLTLGVAIIKLSVASTVGMAMIVFGGAMSAVGAFHYLRTNKQIIDGKVESSNWLVLSISASVIALSIAVIIYLAVDAAKK
jgi:putative membrane protein